MGKYTDSKTVQILIAILKGHGIRKIVISPGTTNFMFVVSVQNDKWFEIKSSADERSAAYIACGWAAETHEPVVISCTGATASRNYLPALTEAYYRKLPVLALTSINDSAMPGHNIPQVIDRSRLPIDAAKISVNIADVHDDASARKCIVLANQAILELTRHGGGPAHINLMTKMSGEFNTDTLPTPRIIRRYFGFDNLPDINEYNRIAVYVGSHPIFSREETEAIEVFCQKYNAIVLCDHTSNYKGEYKFLSAYVASQEHLDRKKYSFDLVIDIGEVSGDYYQFKTGNSWRVSEDGEVRDRFGNIKNVFEMREIDFFNYYNNCENTSLHKNMLYDLRKIDLEIRNKTGELPFSNIWIAQQISTKLPQGSVIHFAILNSLRAWNFFDIPDDVYAYSNVGGFGIDGDISTLVGASFTDQEKLYIGIAGDLAFFYDMNSIGNRHVGKNLRIIVINNGKGTEFRNYSHPAAALGDQADDYVAAGGHYGNKSGMLLKHYAEDLGFEYLSARNKGEFEHNASKLLTSSMKDKSILLEVFTDSVDESNALYQLRHTIPEAKAKALVKSTLGEKNIQKLKRTFRRI